MGKQRKFWWAAAAAAVAVLMVGLGVGMSVGGGAGGAADRPLGASSHDDAASATQAYWEALNGITLPGDAHLGQPPEEIRDKLRLRVAWSSQLKARLVRELPTAHVDADVLAFAMDLASNDERAAAWLTERENLSAHELVLKMGELYNRGDRPAGATDHEYQLQLVATELGRRERDWYYEYTDWNREIDALVAREPLLRRNLSERYGVTFPPLWTR